MEATEFSPALGDLLSELVDGAPQEGAYILNRGDPGLLASLDRLSAEAASTIPSGGSSSIASHVDHLRYGLSLMNRWTPDENPFAEADWTMSWRKTDVTSEKWERLRIDLAEEAHRWLDTLNTPRDLSDLDAVALEGMIGSIGHLAYHLGAIRQIDRATRGPSAEEG